MRVPIASCRLVLTCVGLAAVMAAPAVLESRQQEKFTGFAINTNSGPSTAMVDFTVTRWLAWDLHYARQSPLDEGGRQIDNLVLEHFAAQPMRFNEITRLK
jgi:hypothetical protein